MRTFSVTDEYLEELFVGVMPHLDERQRRIVAANVALSLGRGGITAVSEASSMSRSTVQSAVTEVDAGIEVTNRVRRPSAGGKQINDVQPGLVQALDDLVEPDSRGCPMSPLRWTAKSTRDLAEDLCKQGYQVSHNTVYLLLVGLGYSLQSPSKSVEGKQHPDRDGQFRYLNEQVSEHPKANEPVISVDRTRDHRVSFPTGTSKWNKIEHRLWGEIIPESVR